MTPITFRRVTAEESRIYQGTDHIGDVYRQPDILNPGAHYYVVSLDEDPRGPCRVYDRARLRELTRRLVASHPFW